MSQQKRLSQRYSNADIQMLTSLETGNGGRECHSVMAEGNVMTLQTRADGGRECHAGREGNASSNLEGQGTLQFGMITFAAAKKFRDDAALGGALF